MTMQGCELRVKSSYGHIITYGNTLFSLTLGTNEVPFNANKRKRQGSGDVEIEAKHKN